jgi:hypothetical protein
MEVYGRDVARHHVVGSKASWDAASADVNDKNKQAFVVQIPPDPPGAAQVLARAADNEAFLIIRYQLGS